MKTIEISDEQIPGSCTRPGNHYSHSANTGLTGTSQVTAEVQRGGDVYLFRRNKMKADELLTVIPKDKRAALAQFLIDAK